MSVVCVCSCMCVCVYSSGQKKGLVPYSLNDRTDAALRFKK